MVEERLKELLVAVYKQGYEEAIQEAARFARRARTITEFLLFLNSKLSVLDTECENKADELLRFAREFEENESRKKSKEGEEIEFRAGQSILFCEEKPSKSVDWLIEIANEKRVPALCLSRKPKEIFAGQERNMKNFTIVWLSKVETDGGLGGEEGEYTPTGLSVCEELELSATQDINRITSIVQDYISKNSPPVIYLDGLSYLVTQTDFMKVLKLVQWLSEQIAVKGGYLIVSADPDAFEKKDFEKLKNEMSLVR